MTVHELAHGLVAYWLGDDTAKQAGRLTLNPFSHIDWLGLICLVIARIGWAKPVPVNLNNFKNPRWGMALCALAGPVANILLAFISVLCFLLIGVFTSGGIWIAASEFIQVVAMISAGIAVFNLIPIPPLDGSRILAAFLPGKLSFWFQRYGMVLQIVLLAMIFLGTASSVIIKGQGLIISFFYNLCLHIFIALGIA